MSLPWFSADADLLMAPSLLMFRVSFVRRFRLELANHPDSISVCKHTQTEPTPDGTTLDCNEGREFEITRVGWFDTYAGQFWSTYLLPLPADVNEENRIQLAERYQLHVSWMNAKSHVFMPLARLIYPPDAFEKRSIDLRCRYVGVYASEEKTTAKTGVRHQWRQWQIDMASRPLPIAA